MHGRGQVWQGDIHHREYAWWGACMAGGVCERGGGMCGRWHAWEYMAGGHVW